VPFAFDSAPTKRLSVVPLNASIQPAKLPLFPKLPIRISVTAQEG
jgi:hypothetical protein